jgi:hypothetical protein
MNVHQRLTAFFTDYETRFNRFLSDSHLDLDGQVGAFADCFVESSPVGVSCGKNDDQFRKAIPEGFAFYKSIGTQSMKIGALDITPLDDYHAMVKVHWESHYKKPDGSPLQIDFDVIYMLQILDDQPRIFAYITGDEQGTLQKHGLIPAETANMT